MFIAMLCAEEYAHCGADVRIGRLRATVKHAKDTTSTNGGT